MVERAQPAARSPAAAGPGFQARRRQPLRRQIATALAQVRRQIAQDVHQLQPFAEPHPVRQQECVIVQRRPGEKMRAAHLRPELPHAAGHAIGVVVQLLIRAQRHERPGRRAGEPAQVQFLPAGDRVEHLAHELPVGGRQAVQQRQARLAFLQQHAFGARTLPLGQRAEIQRRARSRPESARAVAAKPPAAAPAPPVRCRRWCPSCAPADRPGR